MSRLSAHLADHVEEVDVTVDRKQSLGLLSSFGHGQQLGVVVFEHILDILILLFVKLTLAAAVPTRAIAEFSEVLLASFAE